MANVSNNELSSLRHSCEHVLQEAVIKLFPAILPAMGPATSEGFYFDFDPNGEVVTESDFPKIEAEMKAIVKSDLTFSRKEVTIPDAKKLFSKNPYKLEWLEEIEKKGGKPTIYSTGETYFDLCSGPHVKATGDIGNFKLLSIAGAYWRGEESNKMLKRIYGACFANEGELEGFLSKKTEAEKRDHRKIGKDLNLFVFSDLVGKGLPLLTPAGTTIKRELERFIVDEEIKRGYQHVTTPPLAKLDLYKISGHYPYYKETMYPPMKVDEEELILRPMTCPHHFMLYKSQMRSYRDLPLKFAELSPQFRYEKSGELSGLFRIRMFCLSDAHIFTTSDEVKKTIKEVLDLINFVNNVFGLEKGIDYRFRLSLGKREDEKKYYKDDKAWTYSENVLREVLTENNEPFFEAEDEAAFYGPKIDIQLKNIHGKEETAYTVQYDFVMPKRFDLKYTSPDGSESEPVVIHRSSLGALERTMGFLIEKYSGAFPVWLAPTQAIIIPISDKNNHYARNVRESIRTIIGNLRVSIDERTETMSSKIRDAQLNKIPYMIIVGGKEEETETITVRFRNGKSTPMIKLEEFALKTKQIIENRSLDL